MEKILSVTYMIFKNFEEKVRIGEQQILKQKADYYIKKASFGSKMCSLFSLVVKGIHFTSSFQNPSN